MDPATTCGATVCSGVCLVHALLPFFGLAAFGPRVAQVAAIALLIDYVVTVAVQTAAGSAAIVSAFPALAILLIPPPGPANRAGGAGW